MSSSTLAMRVRREPGGTAIITVTGEIDIATVAGLRDRLFTLADTSRSVIIDLDQVSFIDAAGLGALVGAARRADIHGASLQVVCGQPQTRELFRLAGLDPPAPPRPDPSRNAPGPADDCRSPAPQR